jgi:uncharacterized protein YecT (DUF1311 family)
MSTRHATPLRSPALAILVLLIAPGAAVAGQAAEQGIDCKKAVSTPEVAVCASDAYDAADAKLNAAYKVAMASIAKRDLPPDVQKEFRKALVEAQRKWIAYRDAECEVTGYGWYGGTGRSTAIIECSRGLTEARTKALLQHAE